MENKICIVGVYFGPLPKYLSLWLKSAAHNRSVDFFLFTDQKVAGDVPANVHVVSMDLPEMQRRASAVLGFDANLSKPYKCCDYKPLYGLIFSDHLHRYDYWGHCDFDLIFGDLQALFDRYGLYRYDRFLALGHLSLYRNTEEVNRRYTVSGSEADYVTVFTNDRPYVFDEIPGMTAVYLQHQFPFFHKNIFADIACTYDRFRIINTYALDAKVKNYPHQIFCWEEGKIYRYYEEKGEILREEKLYIHFKKRPNFSVDFPPEDCSAFFITKFGFVKREGEVTLADMKRLNPYKGRLYEGLEKCKYRWPFLKAAFLRRLKRVAKP